MIPDKKFKRGEIKKSDRIYFTTGGLDHYAGTVNTVHAELVTVHMDQIDMVDGTTTPLDNQYVPYGFIYAKFTKKLSREMELAISDLDQM